MRPAGCQFSHQRDILAVGAQCQFNRLWFAGGEFIDGGDASDAIGRSQSKAARSRLSRPAANAGRDAAFGLHEPGLEGCSDSLALSQVDVVMKLIGYAPSSETR